MQDIDVTVEPCVGGVNANGGHGVGHADFGIARLGVGARLMVDGEGERCGVEGEGWALAGP